LNLRPLVSQTYQLFPHLPSDALRSLNAAKKAGPLITSRYPLPALIGTAVLPPCFPEGK